MMLAPLGLSAFPCRPRHLVVALVALCLLGCRTGTAPAPSPRASVVPQASPTAADPQPQLATADVVAGQVATDGVSPDEPRRLHIDPATLKTWLRDLQGQQWYGVYMLGTKVGYAHVGYRPSTPEEPGAYAMVTEMEMRVKGLGSESEMAMTERRFYGAHPPHGLVATSMEERSPGGSRRREGVAGPGGMVITNHPDRSAAGPRTVPGSEETLVGMLATVPPDLSRVRVGDRARVEMFDWTREADVHLELEVKGLEKKRLAGVSTWVATLTMTIEEMGLTSTARVADGGLMLETTVGPGIALRLEEEAVARGGVKGLDVLGTAVPVDTRLGDPTARSELQLRVRIPEEARIPQTARQQVAPLDDGTLRVELKRGPGDPVQPAERKRATEPDATVDSGHPAIQAKARELLRGIRGRRAQVERLVHWVYDSLDKKLATHIPTASQVLVQKTGDCTEHAWLFSALARAAGIPARPVYGLMYLGDEMPGFGYHAWAEAEVDGRWLPVDPAWREVPVDATHLRLGLEGFEVAAVIGGIAIRVEPQGRPK